MKLQSIDKSTHHKHLLAALADRRSGVMTEDELTATCYRWSYQYAMEALRYKQEPDMPTFYLTYRAKSEAARKRAWAEDAVLRGKVLGFLTEQARIRNENDANKDWLKKMLAYFDQAGEADKVEAIRKVLGGYGGKAY